MTLAEKTWEIAHRYEGMREDPPGSNHGPDIDVWVREGGGLDPGPPDHKGPPYCASGVSYWIKEATKEVGGDGGPPRFVGGASVLKLKERNAQLHLTEAPVGEVVVFLILHPDGSGHCGLGRAREDGTMDTREANTGPGPAVAAKDRDGEGYFERHDRHVRDCTGGFLRIG